MDDYEKFEEECKKIRKANGSLLDEFATQLRIAGLSDTTIKNHLSNIDYYINYFLLYDEAIEAKEGWDCTNEYLGYWFIKKAMWASSASIKSNAASLKKFYTFMQSQGDINQEQLKDLKQTIKEDMPEWLACLDRFDDPSVGFEDVFF